MPQHTPVPLFIDSGLSLIAGSQLLAGPASLGGAQGWLTPRLPINIPATCRAHTALLADGLRELLQGAWRASLQSLENSFTENSFMELRELLHRA